MGNLVKTIKKIALDEDGVKTPYYDYMMERAVPFCKKFYDKEVINPEEYDIKDIFGITSNQRLLFWLIYIWGLFSKQEIDSKALEVIEKWIEEARQIDIITARVYVAERTALGALARRNYLRRFDKDNIPFGKEHIHFCSEKNSAVEKTRYIEELGSQIILEDKVDNIDAIVTQTDCKVIMPEWPYNKDYDNLSIIKVPYETLFPCADKIVTYLDEGYPFEEVKKLMLKK